MSRITLPIEHAERVLLNQALAKAIAYKNCGQQRKAEAWAAKIVYLLDVMDICDQSRLDAALAEVRD